jgi:hypothetical protein
MGDIKDIIRKVIREDFINELSKNDVHVKEIMKFYDKGTYSTKKAVSIFVSGKTNASRNQILDDLGDMGYNDVWEVMDHFKLKIESVNETTLNEGFGDSIKKIKSLAIKMASTKYDRAKSHLNIDKIASADKFDGSDAMNKATSALLQQNDLDEDLKSTINSLAVKLGTGATMMGIITALVSMSGWIQYLDSSFTKWYYTEIQKLAEPEVMKVMQDMGSAGQAEGSIYGKLGMYAFFIFFTIAVISLVAARMTQKPKNEYVDDKDVEHVAAALPQTEEEPVTEALVKGKTYGGSKCEGGCFVGKSGLMKIIKISKDSPKDVFMFRDDNYSGLQPHFIKNGVIAKATVINPAYDLEKHKVKNLKIGNDVILSVRLFVSTNESVMGCKTCNSK